MSRKLSGHTAIVAVDTAVDAAAAAELARRLHGEGAGVVLVSSDAARGGRLAAGLDAGDSPVAVFCPEGDLVGELDALVELVAELSRTGGR